MRKMRVREDCCVRCSASIDIDASLCLSPATFSSLPQGNNGESSFFKSTFPRGCSGIVVYLSVAGFSLRLGYSFQNSISSNQALSTSGIDPVAAPLPKAFPVALRTVSSSALSFPLFIQFETVVGATILPCVRGLGCSERNSRTYLLPLSFRAWWSAELPIYQGQLGCI